MNMYVMLVNTNQSTDVFNNIVEFTYNVNMYPIKSECSFVVLRPSNYYTYKTAKVYLEGSLLFQGIVTKQADYLGQDGAYFELTCSGYEMGLTENQVRPRTMEDCSSTTVYNNYASSYGILSNGLTGATIPQLTITAGMTAWNAIDMFCRQAYNYLPFISREGMLTINYLNGDNYVIGNNGTGHPYTKLRFVDDRSKMLSRIYRKSTTSDSYTSYHDYATAADYGITRERYYTLPTAWESYPDTAVSQVLRNAALDSLSVEVVLPELLAAYPGDTITFQDEFFSEKNYYVSAVSMICNSGGYYTTLKLWDMLRN